MKMSMLASCHDFEVAWCIVTSIMILMVDGLIGRESSAKLALNDNDVFVHIIIRAAGAMMPRYLDEYVAIGAVATATLGLWMAKAAFRLIVAESHAQEIGLTFRADMDTYFGQFAQ